MRKTETTYKTRDTTLDGALKAQRIQIAKSSQVLTKGTSLRTNTMRRMQRLHAGRHPNDMTSERTATVTPTPTKTIVVTEDKYVNARNQPVNASTKVRFAGCQTSRSLDKGTGTLTVTHTCSWKRGA